nr:DMT family transporter [Bacillus wiedmannii]
MDRSITNIKNPIKQSAPWWVWVGGIIGGAYVLINVYLVDQIGNGQTVVLVLFGQITGSLIVEQFGLFNSFKTRIKPIKIFGLIVMIAGVFLIRGF